MARCSSRSPLIRSGTPQAGRDIVELQPAYFRIDERDLADMVLYAQALSREIAYYNSDNQPAGDWEAFFASDVTATLAALARLPVESFRIALGDAQEFLRDDPERAEPELRAYFNLLFHLPVALFGELAKGHARLNRDHPLHGLLTQLVENDLAGPLEDLLRFYKGALGAGLPLEDPEPPLVAADYGSGAPADPKPRLSDTVAAAVFVPEVLTQRAIAGPAAEALGAADWTAFAAGIAGDPTPYQQASGPHLLYEQIYDALTYNLLSTPLERIFQALERARQEAQKALERSLQAVDDHTPHYGLYLAFLDMLAVARDELNGMTARHLDFYYGEVLRMVPRAPVPDSVHLLFDLAKGTQARAIAAGTGLRAGKDALGKDVEYRTTDDIVVNRGKVAELRAVHVHSLETGGKLHQTVFASPVANSLDGLGEEPVEAGGGWRPFGPLPYPEGAAEAQAPVARVGFALADRRLFLREGNRGVLMAFELDAPLPDFALADMRVRLTTPEGWHEVAGLMAGPIGQPNLLLAIFLLDGDQPAVVPFDPALHAEDNGGGYEAGLPVAELIFDFKGANDVTARAFAVLRSARIEKAYLYAAAAGLRSLSFQTPDGVADPSKPFAAFGARPKVNSALIIGSAELMAKPLASLNLHLAWEETYSSSSHFRDLVPASYTCDVSYLSKGAWQGATSTLGLQFQLAKPMLTTPDTSLIDGAAEMTLDNPVYGPGARRGFLKLELNADFGHAAYAGELTRATIAMANSFFTYSFAQDPDYNYDENEDSRFTPKLPYTPAITEVTASYTTTLGAPARFYHVAPFGQAAREAAGASLLPPLDYEAALFVGVEDFEAPARLSLLMQVANGSGDPLLEVPELAFHYLAGDSWTALLEQEVDDKTGNLAASAVLGLALPEAADSEHGLMPSGLHWLRLAAPQNAAAVNSLIAVEAQAVRASFADRNNDPQFLAAPLPPETIAKLVLPDPKVKKLRQPFASFGGRPEESPEAFRRRASERLRHKDRAVALWDYEHLVLEAAPELYRVKCLNHTELVREAGKVVADNELSPGGVVVVTVPWTLGRPHLDPLRPYTDQATLKKVRDLLMARISPFVRLEVANPKFEEVQVKFKVAFLDGIDDIAFYLGEVEKAVIGYLAPWSVGAGEDITFGGKLRKSSVIDFVEELPYVDFLEDFEMYHRPDPDLPAWTPADMETIEATTARSILVSARNHIIEELV
jgi:hypothetical protein